MGRIADDSVVLDTGEVLRAGADGNGQPAVVKVARCDADAMERDPEVLTEDLANVRFLKDREAFTIALVPADVIPPAPRPERLTFLDVVNPRALTSDPSAPAPTTGG